MISGDLEERREKSRVIYSNEMLLFGPEGLEGQKIREAQHEFSNARACECFASATSYFTAMVNHDPLSQMG